MSPSKMYRLAKAAVNGWIDDYAPSMGAAISYYTVFSIAPLLLIVIVIAGFVFGQDAVRGSLQVQMSGLLGKDGADAIQGLVASAYKSDESLVASAISIVVLLVGATTVFAELQSALDRIWHVPEKAKPSGLWGILRARFLSFGLILGLAFLLITSLAVSAAIAAFGTWFGGLMPGWEILLHLLNIVIALAVETVLFAMIYKFMPSTRVEWPDVWIGGLVTGCLFELGKTLIGLYMGKAGVSSSYAAAGSIAVVLIWVYYATQVFLLGAEFTKVYAEDRKAAAEVSSASAPVTSGGSVETERPRPVSASAGNPLAPPKPPVAAPLATRMAVSGGLFLASTALKFWLERRRRA